MSNTLEAMRLHENQLQMSVLEFRHEETGSNVGLVSTVHFGEPAFYSEISDYADSHQKNHGACVYYEGAARPSSEELADASPAEQKRTKHLDRAHKIFMDGMGVMMRRGLGLVRQADSLDHTGWEGHDVTYLELAQQLGRFGTLQLAMRNRLGGAIFGMMPSFLACPMARGIMKGLLLPQEESRERRVLVHNRSQIVLNAIDERREDKPGQDFVLIWGGGHAIGIGSGLIERDYDHVHTRWVPIADLG